MARRGTGPVLSRRALNRALLARQLLLHRDRRSAVDTVAHLVGMQSQSPDAAYFGLWSRIEGFAPAELADLVLDRRVVRIALMRSTIHLVTAADCLALRPVLQPVLDRGLQGTYGARLAGLDRAEVATRGRALVEAAPLTFSQLGAGLAPAFPGRDPDALAMAVRSWVPLVQVPPRGVWGRPGRSAHTSAEQWLGTGTRTGTGTGEVTEEAVGSVVLRYLAAFGPASVADVQKWSGLTRLGEVVDRIGDRLATFSDGNGLCLYDLPDAPRPDPDAPAPARLLAEYDNVLLSHADRTRILGDVDPRMVMTPNGLVLGSVLLDGFVAGRWRLVRPRDARASVTVTTMRRIGAADRAALVAEAGALLAFASGGAGSGASEDAVRFQVSSTPATRA